MQKKKKFVSIILSNVMTLSLLFDFQIGAVSGATCSFGCSITSNQDKVPFYTGPFCSNDPLGWAFGHIGIRPHCGKTCSMLEAECNDNPSDPNGIVPQVLNKIFMDCCDDYQPKCSFCEHGLVEPNAYSTEETLYRLNSISSPIISNDFRATCAELEAYYDMKVSSSDDFENECPRMRNFFLTVDDSSSRTYLAGCQCDPGPPTISPVPTEVASDTPSMVPTTVVTQEGLPCGITKEDYSNPGWYYSVAIATLLVYFIPTISIAIILMKGYGSSKKIILYNLVTRFLSDLGQSIFILINVYAYHYTMERRYCDETSFQISYITASFALGMDLVGDLLAIGTIDRANISQSDSIESAKWKCMEFLGGWTNNFFCVISATGSALIGAYLIFGSVEGVNSTISLVIICLYYSITLGGYLFQPIYSSLFDADFRFADWCAAQFIPCQGLIYACKYNSWRNKSGVQPHCGPIWGGAARVFLEYSTIVLMVIEFLLNLESNIATIVLLGVALISRIAKSFSGCFSD